MTDKAFYIGSCRYQPYFRNHFPPRLHTTKEVLQFLENHSIISLTTPRINLIYGDSIHPSVRRSTEAYLANPTLVGSHTLCLEICSRKVDRLEGSYLNHFYVTQYCEPDTALVVLENAELLEDLRQIRTIAAAKFGVSDVVVIPHINLRCRSGGRIPERDSLYTFLTEQQEFDVIDITRHIERVRSDLFLEDVLGDGYHYSGSVATGLARECIRAYFEVKGRQ
jgi:hypothetical protein